MVKTPHFVIETYTQAELDKVEQIFLETKQYMPTRGGDFIRRRDLAIFKTADILGLRPSECLCLTWWNIDWEKSEIKINPYTNKERDPEPIILNEKAKYILKGWKQFLGEFLVSDFVFPCLATMEPLSSSAWHKRLAKILDEAKIRKILWYTQGGQPIYDKKPYSSRKTFGTRLMRNSKDPYLVARALRHKDLRQIHRYVQLDKTELKDNIDRFN